MAFKTFIDGLNLPAADLNTYLMKQAVVVCTAATRPASPPTGMVIYETDTNKLLQYTTATTLWQPPWNLPWGRIAHASSATAMGATSVGTTDTDITGITTGAITTVASRYYRITGTCTFDGASNNCDVFLKILQGAVVQDSTMGYLSTTTPSRLGLTVMTILSPGSGSFTFKLQASTSVGTIRGIGGGASATAKIIVEDIGPNGAPV